MTINGYKEILNIASSIWISKGITGIEFKEQLVVEKDIDPNIVHDKYMASKIGSVLTHSCVGYQIQLLYHKNNLHGVFSVELVFATEIELYIAGKMSAYQLFGTENICNLYQTFVQTLLVAGVELKLNNYVNTSQANGDIQRRLDILHKNGIDRKEIGSHTETAIDNTNIS